MLPPQKSGVSISELDELVFYCRQLDLEILGLMCIPPFDKDPNKYTDAKKYLTLNYQQVLSDEIAVMDSTAIALCKDNNIPIVVFDIFKKGNILKAVTGEPIGSLIR